MCCEQTLPISGEVIGKTFFDQQNKPEKSKIKNVTETNLVKKAQSSLIVTSEVALMNKNFLEITKYVVWKTKQIPVKFFKNLNKSYIYLPSRQRFLKIFFFVFAIS
jgi:hypothetical protein